MALSVAQDDEVKRHTTFCQHTLEGVFTDMQSQVDSVQLSLSDQTELLRVQVRASNLTEHYKGRALVKVFGVILRVPNPIPCCIHQHLQGLF